MTKLTSSAAKGYDNRWKKARIVWLQANPFCVECRKVGLVVPATVVDHVKPHRLGQAIESGDPDRITAARRLFWDRTNWQSLCKPCHDSYKQRVEKSGEPGCSLDGIPHNASHHWNRT
ncbi:MAG: HNH endonuclease [Gammaproteobacteria bacterium HGW-Gammaproteobacteria-11]|nr:MAG: HNH endonuclease [Gammaproteobacteria bacterium HGW-Gammaproteobacteria-11]